MKNPKKALLLLLGVVVLVASSVFATLAYFTDSEAVTNTFSVGQVGIDLDELDVDNSSPLLNRDKSNKYHLIPGSTYDKDPTVHVDADSEDAWLFVKVENGIAAIEAATDKGTIAQQILANGWTALPEVENVYYCKYDADANPKKSDFVVFGNFKIDGDKTVNVPTGATAPANTYDIAAYKDATITVTAYAIQMAGFEPKIADGANEAAVKAANDAAAAKAWEAGDWE